LEEFSSAACSSLRALTNAFQTNIGLIGGLMLAAAQGLRP
jgi:hypothetical protein